ncbi:trypsin-like peptidase domain-containing protein [Streptomyces sp. NPDC048384]|uniref:trypsin-like peptidase domain-containing protein n=1 Tax=Streptomyces sp. NPDC048384 TaxID=3155487 RepID=UPI0034483CCA
MASRSDRVVQVVAREAGGPPFFVASGFLLADGLVITAAHPVESPSRSYEVRPDCPAAPVAVRRVVRAADRDVALLILDGGRYGLAPLRFAELPEDIGQVAVHAVGFPRFTVEDGRPRGHQLDATVQLGSDRAGHQFQLSVTSSDPPEVQPGRSAWEGYSGAGLLTRHEGLVAGVVTSHRPGRDRRNLTGTDLVGIGAPDFHAVLAEHGVEAWPVPARLLSGSAPTATHWLPPGVREVLERQRAEAVELPYRFRQVRRTPRLTDVYIRQVLSPSAEDTDEKARRAEEDEREAGGSARAGDLLDSGRESGPIPAPQAPVAVPRRLEDVLDDILNPGKGGHLLVEAGPGAGKSTLLHTCSLELGDAALAATTVHRGVVPVWVTATRLAEAGHSLESAVAAATGLDGPGSGTPHATGNGGLPRLPPGARWLVLIDALDEVHHDQRSRLIHRLADHARQGAETGVHMLLTSRPDPDAVPELTKAGFHRYALDPFDRTRLEEFVRIWFENSGEGGRTAAFLRQIDETGVSDLLRNPLLATVTAVVHEYAPEKPLPDNIWGLYKEFLLHLRDVKREQADRLWQDLADRAADTRQGTSAVTYLREHLAELVSHVAYAQVAEGVQNLPMAARRWWEQTAVDEEGRPFGAAPPLNAWPAALTDALLSTGLFVRQGGGGLEFLHTTFAEHMAAEWLVSRLPERFDITDDRWRAVLVAASGRTAHPLTALHRQALVHYGHRHSAAGRSMLNRLQSGLLGNQLLAATLLADRCPADDDHYRRFLDVLRARREYRDDVWDLLARMRHPLVTSYLRERLRDGEVVERVLAAEALVAREPDAVAAVLPGLSGLRMVPLEKLREVAVSLAEARPEHTGVAAEVLLAVAQDERASADARQTAAYSLGSFGAEYTGMTAEALRSVIGRKGDTYGHYLVHSAMAELGQLGGEYEEEAANRLFWTAVNPLDDGFDRESAASYLAHLGGGRHRDRAAEALHWMLESGHERDRSARALADLGDSYTAEAVRRLRAVVTDPDAELRRRRAAAESLKELANASGDSGARAEAVRAWRLLADDNALSPSGRWSALRHLADLGERKYADEARERLLDVMTPAERDSRRERPSPVEPPDAVGLREVYLRRLDRYMPEERRLEAAQALIAQDEVSGAKDVVLRLCHSDGWGTSRGTMLEESLALLRRLRAEHPERIDQALRDVLADDHAMRDSAEAALDAALSFGILSLSADAATLLDAAERGTYTKLRDRVTAFLRSADETQKDGLVAELDRRLTSFDGRSDVGDTAQVLWELGEEQARRVGTALRARLADADTDTATRRGATQGLLALGGEFVPLDVEVLQDFAAFRAGGTGQRLRAVEVRLCLEGRATSADARALTGIAKNLAYDDTALKLLYSMGAEHSRRARGVLRRQIGFLTDRHASKAIVLAGCPASDVAWAADSGGRWSWRGVLERQGLALTMARLGGRYVDDAARVLLKAMAKRSSRFWYERGQVAADLVALGDPYVDELLIVLRENPSRRLDNSQMVGVLRNVAVRDGRHAAAVADLLSTAVTSYTYLYAREALSVLLDLGPDFRPQALAAVHAVADREYGSATYAQAALDLLERYPDYPRIGPV